MKSIGIGAYVATLCSITVLSCSRGASREAVPAATDTAVPAPSLAIPTDSSRPAQSIPSQAIHWTVPQLVTVLGSAGLGDVHVAGGPPRLDGVTFPDSVILRNAALVDVGGARIVVVEMSDPISATRATEALRRANPRAGVFTSNNALVVGLPSPTLDLIRDSLTTVHIRSARR